MKKLFQLNLLLLFVSSAAAQEASPPTPATQPTTKILRVYDWNNLAQHQLAGGEVIQMDGMSVLKLKAPIARRRKTILVVTSSICRLKFQF